MVSNVSFVMEVVDDTLCGSFFDPKRSRSLLSLLRLGKLRKKSRFSFFLLVRSGRVSAFECGDVVGTLSVEGGAGVGGTGRVGKGG